MNLHIFLKNSKRWTKRVQNLRKPLKSVRIDAGGIMESKNAFKSKKHKLTKIENMFSDISLYIQTLDQPQRGRYVILNKK